MQLYLNFKMLGNEMVVGCSPSDAGIITVWNISSASEIMHFHGCISASNSLATIGSSFIAASQINNPCHPETSESTSSAPICLWTWNTPHIHDKIYPPEKIGPLTCTTNGTYLMGGGISGQLHIWEMPTKQLIRSWRGHKKPVSCSILTDDESLLVSGGDDGFINVWPLIRILDVAEGSDGDREMHLPFLYSWDAHSLPVTGLVCGVGGCNAILVSCSLDCTVKIWSLGLGSHLRTLGMPCAINCVVVDPSENALYAGGTDGNIYVGVLKVFSRLRDGIGDENGIIGSLFDHSGPITALGFSMDGVTLVSASEDCTIRLWDTCSNCVIRVLNHCRGPVSSILILPMLPQVSGTFNHGLQLPTQSIFKGVGSFGDYNYSKDVSRLFLPKIGKTSIAVESECYSMGIMERRIKELEAMKSNLSIVNEDRQRALDMLDKLIGIYHKVSGLCTSEAMTQNDKRDTKKEQGSDSILFLHERIEEGRRML